MKKQIKKNDIGLEIHEAVLDNGLRIFVVPMKFSQAYATFSTDFGSIASEFKPHGQDEFVRVNDGIAHFLEHKMFEQPNGTDVFSFFNKSGAKANANTSYTKTTYLFSATDKVIDNVEFLIDYVQEPHFTDENVEKEKGIIEQEIKMYDDMPESVMFEKTMENLFIKSPYKIPIIGNKESIYELTKEDLYLCYNTFYHPSNMYLVVTGNVDPEEVINRVKENQDKKDYKFEEKIKEPEIVEPDEVEKDYEEVDMNQAVPKLNIGFKINTNKSNLSREKKHVYLRTYMNLNFGSTSDFKEEAKKEELYNGYLYANEFDVKSHSILFTEAETEKPEELRNKIMETMGKINFTKEDFERQKKIYIGSYIESAESIFRINNELVHKLNSFGQIYYNTIEKLKDLKYEELVDLINNTDFTNHSTVLIK